MDRKEKLKRYWSIDITIEKFATHGVKCYNTNLTAYRHSIYI